MAGEILSGREPLPWMLIPIKVIVTVWDRSGRRANVNLLERIVIQGTENVKALRPKLYNGCTIFAIGQGVPSYAVCGDNPVRGTVTIAHVCQVVEPVRKEE